MKLKTVLLAVAIIFGISLTSFAQTTKNAEKKAKVTFIELGSVKCIPCQKMEVVLESIRKKYPNDVKVIFYDVWTDAGKPYATQYKVKTIPTQVFLDANGKEYFRHIGFFPEEELIKILEQKGVKGTSKN